MDIEAIVINTARAWAYDKGTSWTDHMRAALTELSAAHAIEMRAYEATVQNLQSRIRQLEAPVAGGSTELGVNDRSVNALHADGYAVVVFNPDELGTADPMDVCDRLIELGWDVIETLSLDRASESAASDKESE